MFVLHLPWSRVAHWTSNSRRLPECKQTVLLWFAHNCWRHRIWWKKVKRWIQNLRYVQKTNILRRLYTCTRGDVKHQKATATRLMNWWQNHFGWHETHLGKQQYTQNYLDGNWRQLMVNIYPINAHWYLSAYAWERIAEINILHRQCCLTCDSALESLGKPWIQNHTETLNDNRANNSWFVWFRISHYFEFQPTDTQKNKIMPQENSAMNTIWTPLLLRVHEGQDK